MSKIRHKTKLYSLAFAAFCLAPSLWAAPSDMMRAIRQDDWSLAQKMAQQSPNTIDQEIYTWHALRAGEGTLDEYRLFWATHPNWPDLPKIQAKGELLLPGELSSRAVVAHFTLYPPQTSLGLLTLMRAYLDLDHPEMAQSIFENRLERIVISKNTMVEIKPLIPNWTDSFIARHVSYLLYMNETALAQEYLPLLDKDTKNLIEARILIKKNPRGSVVKTLNQFPNAITKSGDFGFEYASYLFARGGDSRKQAERLVIKHSTSRADLGRTKAWSKMRESLARDLLWEKEPKQAYELASRHFLEPEEEGYVALEWLAGFIALTFLEDQTTAQQHFKNSQAASTTPISKGRAGYWLGRSGDPAGYAYGAQFQTSFYGQLSAYRGQIPYDQALIDAPRPDLLDHLRTNALFVVGTRYLEIDEHMHARRFFTHLSQGLPPQEAESLGIYLTSKGLADISTNIGKDQAKNNIILTHSYYPIPDLFEDALPIEKALALSITRQESEFYPEAHSSAGAYGLMQLMPRTAKEVAARHSLGYRESWLTQKPHYNIDLGTRLLSDLGQKYQNHIPLMAIAYNAGPSRVTRWQERLGPFPEEIDAAITWIEMIPFDETRNYVERILEGVFLYDSKIRGEFGTYTPEALITKPYPN